MADVRLLDWQMVRVYNLLMTPAERQLIEATYEAYKQGHDPEVFEYMSSPELRQSLYTFTQGWIMSQVWTSGGELAHKVREANKEMEVTP